jgi:hypothetical protein
MEFLPSGLPDQVADDEDLARFLVQSNQFNETVVKPAAFLPNPKKRETSISRHGAEPAQRLWEIGLVAAGTRSLYGAAILKAWAVREASLDVFSDEPPPRHGAIRRWPWIDDDPELQRAQQKERALALASASGKPLLRQ